VSGVLKTVSITIALLMLGVSCYHGGSFMWRTSGEGWQRFAMVLTVFGLLAASHCLAHFVGHAIKRGLVFIAILCAVTVLPIEVFSIATSGAALDSRVVDSVRRENHSSPEYKAHMRTVNNLQAQIESLRLSADRLPDTYVSKRESLHNNISRLQQQQDVAQQRANAVNVSTTGAVYQSLENSTGITSADVSRTAAVMLSVAPLSLSIALAALSGASLRRESMTHTNRAQTRKKSQRHLQAV
jgi:hypothetical protein